MWTNIQKVLTSNETSRNLAKKPVVPNNDLTGVLGEILPGRLADYNLPGEESESGENLGAGGDYNCS